MNTPPPAERAPAAEFSLFSLGQRLARLEATTARLEAGMQELVQAVAHNARGGIRTAQAGQELCDQLLALTALVENLRDA